MQTAWGRQMVLGLFFLVFGVVTMLAGSIFGVVNLSGMGLAAFLIGLLLVYLPSQPSVAPELLGASVLSSLANVERVLRDLAPETKALYLKVKDRLDVPMVFLALSDNPSASSGIDLSAADQFLLVDSDDLHKTGLLLEAPGASLLAFMEKESGVDFFDLGTEGLLDALRSGMVDSLEAVAEVSGAFAENQVKFRIKDGPLRDLSRSLAESAPKTASRLGCPICSAAICAAVKATKSDLTLEEATHQAGYHNLTLRLSPRLEAEPEPAPALITTDIVAQVQRRR